jgi:hypothetical protein
VKFETERMNFVFGRAKKGEREKTEDGSIQLSLI